MGRINKCIELLEQGLPIIEISLSPGSARDNDSLTYEQGMKMAQTWADLIAIDFEHYAFFYFYNRFITKYFSVIVRNFYAIIAGIYKLSIINNKAFFGSPRYLFTI